LQQEALAGNVLAISIGRLRATQDDEARASAELAGLVMAKDRCWQFESARQPCHEIK